jgi:lipoprotein LpqH
MRQRTILCCDDPPILTGHYTKEKPVKRGVLVVVGGAAIVVAGLAGCSSDKKSTTESSSSSSSSSASVSASASATAGAGSTKVTIDGVDQNMNGTVVCSAMGGNFNIAVGEGASGVAVVMSEDASTVHSVALGNINGVALGFQEGVGGANATATKDGNSYKVTGTATGVDMANPMQPVDKPFEIDVVCP